MTMNQTLKEKIGPTTLNSHIGDIKESIDSDDPKQLRKDIKELRAYLEAIERAANGRPMWE